MTKKLLATLCAVTLLFSIFLTGCNGDSANRENNDDNKQVSSVRIPSDIDSVLNLPLDKKGTVEVEGPSSAKVVELAKNNTMHYLDVKNYYDYQLYVLQNDETIKFLRGNNKITFPMELLNKTNTLSHFDIFYYVEGGNRYNDIRLGSIAYYADYFLFYNGMNVLAFALKSDEIDSAIDCHREIVLADCIYVSPEGLYDTSIYREFDASILDNNNIFKLNKDLVGKPIVASIGDRFALHYDGNGVLDSIEVYYDDVFLHIRGCSESNADDIGGFLAYLLNPNTISLAASAMDTAVKAVEVVTK